MKGKIKSKGSSRLKSIQNLSFRLGIQIKVHLEKKFWRAFFYYWHSDLWSTLYLQIGPTFCQLHNTYMKIFETNKNLFFYIIRKSLTQIWMPNPKSISWMDSTQGRKAVMARKWTKKFQGSLISGKRHITKGNYPHF